ncbi:MAG TPA: transporter substrate-binding domain-containing protein, partial [Burkholderiales bacterium]|nr:transporter substrate-binding domain-containing protein [Burkholderiales bacterium]
MNLVLLPRLVFLACLFLLTACASTPRVSPQVRADLAPTGKLRAGINYANAIVATRDPATGQLAGVSVDLVREVARRLGVPLELTGFDFSGKLADALNAGALDIGGIAGGSGTGREGTMDFTAGYLQIETTYMVAPGSSIRTIAEVDRAGVRVGVADKSAFRPFLAKNLRNAQLLTGPGNPTAFELVRSGKVEVLAGLRHQLAEVQAQLPGSRILDGHFLVVEQTLAIPKGREAGLRFLRDFVEEAKASGFIAR